MKALIILLLFTTQSWALPVLNQNVASNGAFVTVLPDHLDSNTFYYFPQKLILQNDYQWGFTFSEKKMNKKFVTQMNIGLVKTYADELKTTKDRILKINKNASFKEISMDEHELIIPEGHVFFESHSCMKTLDPAVYFYYCEMILTPIGARTLKPFLSSGRIFPMSMSYHLRGVIQKASGYEEKELQYGLPVEIGGEMLIADEDFSTEFSWEK